MKKTQITIGAILTSVIAIIVIGANLYNFQKLVQAKSTLKNLTNSNIELEEHLNNTEAKYIKFKNDNQTELLKYSEKFNKILPSDEAITDFNREIENFSNSLHSLSNPIFLEKMTYGSSKKQEKINGLYIVPVSLSFQGTDKNFYKIIEYLESSGNLENESRLLEITKIAINWEGKEFEKSDIELYDFEINVNIYLYSSI